MIMTMTKYPLGYALIVKKFKTNELRIVYNI